MNINQLNINTIKDIVNIMNEADFIQEMMKQANLTEDQGGMVNEIFQSNFNYTHCKSILAKIT